jgi:hypothetical protein
MYSIVAEIQGEDLRGCDKICRHFWKLEHVCVYVLVQLSQRLICHVPRNDGGMWQKLITDKTCQSKSASS